jgi:hypothetical protein
MHADFTFTSRDETLSLIVVSLSLATSKVGASFQAVFCMACGKGFVLGGAAGTGAFLITLRLARLKIKDSKVV